MPIVTLNARYKSATVDEFIEMHALDVSARGIYIKTDSPIPLGTLLEFEIQIAGKRPVIAGVGRVVWRRDTAHVGPNRPAGVGVKFVKVNKASQEVIDKIVSTKADAGKRYEAEAEVPLPVADAPHPSGPVGPAAASVASAARVPGAQPAGASPARRPIRQKQTLMGVGASLPPVVSPPLPRPVPPPRRAGSLSSAPPAPHPPASRSSASDPDFEQEDLTLMGDLPEMPEERKTTLVGVGAPILPAAPGHRLPRPVSPPRRVLPPAVPPPAATPPTARSPMFPDDVDVDTEDPEEQTRMQPAIVPAADVSPAPTRVRASLPPPVAPRRRGDAVSQPPRPLHEPVPVPSLSPEPFDLPLEAELDEAEPAALEAPAGESLVPESPALRMPVLPQATPGPPIPPEALRTAPRQEARAPMPSRALTATQPMRARGREIKPAVIAGAAAAGSVALVFLAVHLWTTRSPSSEPAESTASAALPATTAKARPVTTAASATAPVAPPTAMPAAPPVAPAVPAAPAVRTAAEPESHPAPAVPPPPEPPARPEVAATAAPPARARAMAATPSPVATTTAPPVVARAAPASTPTQERAAQPAPTAPRPAKPARIDDGF